MTDTLADILDEAFTAISSLVAAEKADNQPAKFSALLRYRQADAQLRNWYETNYGTTHQENPACLRSSPTATTATQS